MPRNMPPLAVFIAVGLIFVAAIGAANARGGGGNGGGGAHATSITSAAGIRAPTGTFNPGSCKGAACGIRAPTGGIYAPNSGPFHGQPGGGRSHGSGGGHS
jgi:hypothetical protein